jgi:pimeloyl-ACP methyl ester carboxylesterase
MPAAFVHGNPETSAIWEPLVAALGRRDVLTLSPPGFGAPVPPGFGATRQEYADWLVGELEAIGAPVDLVGHDWGGGHVLAVAVSRPDLLRSWCTDIAGALHPDYVWHDMAQTWQTPEAGEAAVDAMLAASPEDRTAILAAAGLPAETGRRVVAAFDRSMARCILALYRSAAQPAMAELGEQLPAAAERPGLVIVASEDHYVGTEAMARHSAERAGAQVAVLEGLGHWWMLQDPARGAATLERFWSTVAG